MRKGEIERLCGGIDCFARSNHFTGDRGRDQNFPGIQRQHVPDHMLCKMDHTYAVQLDHVQFHIKVSLCEKAADAYSCVDADDVQWPTETHDGLPELIHAFAASKVSGDDCHVNTESRYVFRRAVK